MIDPLPNSSERDLPKDLIFEFEYASARKIVDQKIQAHAMLLFFEAQKGNYLAFQELYSTAFCYIEALEKLVSDHFLAVRPFVRCRSCWPVLVYPGTLIFREIKDLVNRIELNQHNVVDSNRFCRTPSFARYLCYKLLRSVDGIRNQESFRRLSEVWECKVDNSDELHKKICDLPDLDQKTVTQWFDLCWRILMLAKGGHPERDPNLRKLGMDSDAHSASKGAAEAIIRDNIKKILKQTMRNIIRK